MPLIPDALREDVGEVPGREQDGNDRVDTLWPISIRPSGVATQSCERDSVAPLTNRVFLQALNQRECAAGEAMFLS